MGDFNLPDMDWINWTGPTDGIHGIMLDFMTEANLSQLVQEPTRLDFILELVQVSNNIKICDLQNLPPLESSDHNIVFFKILTIANSTTADPPGTKTQRTIVKWSKISIADAIRQRRETDWESICKLENSPQEVWALYNRLCLVFAW